MKVRWPDTVLQDRGPYTWIESNLFPSDSLEPQTFENSLVLYRCPLPTDLLEFVVFGRPQPARFSKTDLNAAIMAACRAGGRDASAYWWSVNVHDNIARVVERVGLYSFADPLEPLLVQLVYNPATEGGTSYAGLLDVEYGWALSLESGNEFVISVHGPPAFCRQVAESLGASAS
jgi:hypothetical protein